MKIINKMIFALLLTNATLNYSYASSSFEIDDVVAHKTAGGGIFHTQDMIFRNKNVIAHGTVGGGIFHTKEVSLKNLKKNQFNKISHLVYADGEVVEMDSSNLNLADTNFKENLIDENVSAVVLTNF